VSTAIVVFTRDLRTHDQPALAAACAGVERVVPAFILDDAILAGRFHRPNRARFLVDSLVDLDGALRELGSALVVRRGAWVEEVLRVAIEADATEVHVADDVSSYARTRLAALGAAAEAERVSVHRHDSLTVIPPGAAP
jgi:deoxyribodipyrimidine photo-lyase